MRKNLVTILIALVLIVSMSASTMLIPNTNAHAPSWSIPTFAHIYAATNPIGVGERAYVYLFLTPTYADENITNNYRFHNYKLTITAPDGQVETVNWETVVDTTSNQGYAFVPDQIGTYNLTFTYPGQYVNDYPHREGSAYEDDYYLPSNASTTLTVQQEQISYLPMTPLPTEYWTRPISGENSMWWSISSNWLGTGMPGYGASNGPNQRQFPGDAVGSLTSHIVWTKEVQPGGVVGGDLFEDIPGNTWFEGTAYSQRYVNPIIVAGRLYYQEPFSSTGSPGFGAAAGLVLPTVCVDLFTGKEIWRRNDLPTFSFAYIQDMENPDFHGVRNAFLATSNFAQVHDATTGDNVFNVSGVPGGTSVIGPTGELIKYNFYNNASAGKPADYYLTQWNSSRFWQQGSMQQRNLELVTISTTTNVSSTTYVNGVATTTLTPITKTTTQVNASRGLMYDWLDSDTQNKSISWRNSMPGNPSIVGAIYGDILLCMNGSRPTSLAPSGNNPYNYFAVDINQTHGTFGQILWMNTVNPPKDPMNGNITTVSFAGLDKAGYFAESYRQTQQFIFFNLRTGALIKVADPQPSLDYYGSNGPGTLSNVVAFGRLYSVAYSGVLYAYDMATGNVLWTYGNGGVPGNTTYSGFQVPGPYPTFINAIGGHTIEDGVIYTITSEHTFETPIYKGALNRAINASDGTEIWTIASATGEFSGPSYAIADGYSNFFNSYDQRIYTLGRGPSKTTVEVGPKSSTLGGNIVIEGTVTDISAGTTTTEIAARFPDGVPVSSDSIMKEWMEYIHMQQPKPEAFTGVNVHLMLLDSNNNWQDLGNATTDSKGHYSLTWAPNIPGDYKLFAYFEGTRGYWPSNSETVFNMVEPQPTATAQPQLVLPPTETYILGVGVAIILAIAIVGAVILMAVRKRP